MHPRSRAKEFQSILKVVEKAGKKKRFGQILSMLISRRNIFFYQTPSDAILIESDNSWDQIPRSLREDSWNHLNLPYNLLPENNKVDSGDFTNLRGDFGVSGPNYYHIRSESRLMGSVWSKKMFLRDISIDKIAPNLFFAGKFGPLFKKW